MALSKNQKYILAVFLISILNLVVVFLLFGLQSDSDSGSYLGVINYFAGKPHRPLAPGRLLKPGGPLLAAVFSPFFGAERSLIFTNILFYFASLLLIFQIAKLLFKKQKQALLASIFFMSSYSVIRWGVAALTDMSGWFFYLLSIYLTLLFLKNKNVRLVWLNGCLSGVGLFFKETGAMGLLFFVAALLLFREFPWREKVNYALKYLLGFAVPVVLVSSIIFWKIQYSFLDWFRYAQQVTDASYNFGFKKDLLYFLENTFVLMFLGWFFVVRGVFKQIKERNSEKNKILLALIPSSLSFLIWPCWVVRIMFISGPLLCLLASQGLVFNKRKWQILAYLCLLGVILFNLLLPRFIDLSQLQDALSQYFHI